MSTVGGTERFGMRLPTAEREVELSYSVLDTAPIGMVLADGSGTVAWSNEALLEMVGRTREALVAEGLGAVVHPDDWEQDQRLAAGVIAGESPRYELEERWLHADGTTVWVSVTGSLATDPGGRSLTFSDGASQALVRQVVDVTARRQAEEAASRAYAELERRNAELERSNEELAEFTHAVSHDLSEPLRVIAGHVQLLASRYQALLDEDARSWIHFAVDGCARMRVLIDDLLSYSRVGREDRPVRPVDLNEVVADALADAGAAVHDSASEITVDVMPVVLGDRVELTRVVSNLVANAVKFRHPDAAPRVHISAEHLEDGWRIAVSDNGIGIPERHRERIFRAFQRLHGREAYDGTGMGLTIVRKVVLRMGGEVGVEDSPMGGTRVWFTVPQQRDDR